MHTSKGPSLCRSIDTQLFVQLSSSSCFTSDEIYKRPLANFCQNINLQTFTVLKYKTGNMCFRLLLFDIYLISPYQLFHSCSRMFFCSI